METEEKHVCVHSSSAAGKLSRGEMETATAIGVPCLHEKKRGATTGKASASVGAEPAASGQVDNTEHARRCSSSSGLSCRGEEQVT